MRRANSALGVGLSAWYVIAMQKAAALSFAVVLIVSGCGESATGDGGPGGTAGTGGSAGGGGTAGTGGTGATGGEAGSGGGGTGGSADPCDGVDCNDGNDCTADACADGVCDNPLLPGGTECAAGDFPGVCASGLCVGLCVDVDCDDDNECTEDVCDRGDGSCDNTSRPDGSDCDFGGLPGRCTSGVCVDAALCRDVDCGDGNECTDDVCDAGDASCSNPIKPDDSLCQAGDYPGLCASGSCEGLCENVSCDDGNQCTLEQCDPNTGSCSNPDRPNGTTCDFDGLPGRCSSGLCVGLCSGVDCDDDNECTSDSCDATDGMCDYVAVADGTLCVGDAGMCTGGRCTVTESITCEPTISLPLNTSTWPANFVTSRTDENQYTVWDNYYSNVWTGQGAAIEGTITITRVRFCNPVGTPSCTDGALPVTEAKCWPIFPAAYSAPDADGCVDVPLGTAGISVYNVLVNTEQAPVVPCAVGTYNLHYSFGERTETVDRRTGTTIVTYEVAPPVWSHLARDTCLRLNRACGVNLHQCRNTFDALSDEAKTCTLSSLALAEQYPATYCPAAIAGECVTP